MGTQLQKCALRALSSTDEDGDDSSSCLALPCVCAVELEQLSEEEMAAARAAYVPSDRVERRTVR